MLARKHALELKFSQDCGDLGYVALEAQQGVFVAFHLGEFKQFSSALGIVGQRVDVRNYIVNQPLFFAEFARAIGVVPDLGAL